MLIRHHAVLRRIATLLALACLVAAVGAAAVAPAHAAPGGAGELRYFMQASKSRGTALICVGDTVSITVKIVRAQVSQGNVLSTERVTGAKITSARWPAPASPISNSFPNSPNPKSKPCTASARTALRSCTPPWRPRVWHSAPRPAGRNNDCYHRQSALCLLISPA